VSNRARSHVFIAETLVKQVTRTDSKDISDVSQTFDKDAAMPPLHLNQHVPTEPTLQGKSLLRQTTAQPKGADTSPKSHSTLLPHLAATIFTAG